MAARPNATRTLEYGVRLAKNHLDRIDETIKMSERVVEENKLLSPEEIAAYKSCIQIAKKQRKLFEQLAAFNVPSLDLSTKRKRGRPSKSELEAIAQTRKGKGKTAAKAKAAAVASAPAEAPKRRGRPPKAQAQAKVVETASAEAPKRRGRPPKAKAAEAETSGGEGLAALVTTGSEPKRKPGRPKKILQTAPVLNGQNAEVISA